MANRSSAGVLLALALASLLCALVVGVAVYLTGPASELHDVASVARMPIPGAADVDLSAQGYGLYFGSVNSSLHRLMRAPRLDITIEPPQGVPDPGYANVAPKEDVYVDGFHTVQVASIQVSQPGRYHVHVESREENGGSFSIGEPPATVAPAQHVVRAAPCIGFFLLGGLVLGVSAAFARRRTAFGH